MSHRQLFLMYLPTTVLLPTLMCWYLGCHLVGPFKGSRRIAYTAIVLMFVLGISASLALIFWSEADCTPIRPLVTWGFSVLGYLLTASSLLLMRDLLRMFVWLATRFWQFGSTRSLLVAGEKSRQLWYSTTWVLLAAAGALIWMGSRVAALPPSVTQLAVPIRGLDASLEGIRIVHLTDIHIRGSIDRGRVKRLVEQVNALNADLIAFTGDVVDGPIDNLQVELRPLGGLKARHGIYMAVGNHENYAGVDQCVGFFRSLGFHVLLNEHELLQLGPGQIAIAGVTNPQHGMHGAKYTLLQGRVAQMQSDPEGAIRGAPSGIPRILLAHQPKSVAQARGLGFDLALTGHTHGGQFFPWNIAIGFVFAYAAGHYVDGPMQVYVGRGIGTFGPNLRLGASPEIAILKLIAAP